MPVVKQTNKKMKPQIINNPPKLISERFYVVVCVFL